MVRLSGMIARLLYDNHGRGDDDYARYCVLGESGEMVAWIRRRDGSGPLGVNVRRPSLDPRTDSQTIPQNSTTRDSGSFVRPREGEMNPSDSHAMPCHEGACVSPI